MRSKSPASSISSPASSKAGSTVSGRVQVAARIWRLLVQDARRLLVALELEQALHQRLARVLLLLVALRLGGVHGHQHLRLDVDEGGRHHHELAGHVEVQLLHQRPGTPCTGA